MKKIVGLAGVLAFLLLAGSCEQAGGAAAKEEEDEGPQTTPKALTGFSIAVVPDTIIYALNQPFDSAGLVIEGLYDDGTLEELEPTEYTLGEVDTTRNGLKRVTVRVGEFDSQSFWIDVLNDTRVLQSIRLDKPPAKTVYGLGESLNLEGIRITGTYYDSGTQSASTETLGVTPKATGYDKTKRGTQAIGVTANGKTAPTGFTVTVQVPADAALSLNHYDRWGSDNLQKDDMKPVYLKGKDFDIAESNLQATVTTVGGLKLILTPANGGITAADVEGFDKNQAGTQTLTLRLDEKAETFSVEVVEAAPAVWFDYGYMRHEGDAGGEGPGAGKYYARPDETLLLAPVRFLIGYNDDNTDSGASYSWSVSGGSYDTSAALNSEFFSFTPKAAGTYTVTVQVSGRNYINGETITKTASTDVVCYTGTVPTTKVFGEDPSQTYPRLRNFAPGQFTEKGSGYGWSLGATGGYQMWRVNHQASYTIRGNPFTAWSEPGVVWVQEDRNGNNSPDEMWYELKGGDDEEAAYKDLITRRYAITYFKTQEHGTVNEYGQMVRDVYWADVKGRTGQFRAGWPDVWGVQGNWATYTCTLLRDDGIICTGQYPVLDDSWGYVDALNMKATKDGTKFYISDAIRADGSAVTLSGVRFIKVQTAILRYGGIFGEVSTEIHSTDFSGSQTDFPLPEDSDPM